MVAVRDEKGHWLKGQPSPNPSGRAKDIAGWREKLRHLSEAALLRLSAALDDVDAEGKPSRQCIEAAQFVIEQGWGKATQSLQVTGRIDAGPDLSHYTDDELRQLRELTGRAEERARLAQELASESVVEGKLIEGSK